MRRTLSWFGPPGQSRLFTVICLDGAAPGPTVAVTANLHGDECAGIGIIHALLPWLEQHLRRGSVRLYPSLNPEGLRQHHRRLPDDGRDLNRMFPGDPKGNTAERHAAAIFTELTRAAPDLVVDLHADSPGSLPYVLLDRLLDPHAPHRDRLLPSLVATARAAGLTVVWDFCRRDYVAFQLDRSLPGALLNRAGIPAFTLESGSRTYASDASVEAGLGALAGILGHLGLTDRATIRHPTCVTARASPATQRGDTPAGFPPDALRAPPSRALLPASICAQSAQTSAGSSSEGSWRRDTGPRLEVAGFLAPRCTPGRILEAGDPIADVRTLAGEVLQRIVAEGRCFVLSLPDTVPLEAGASACTLAVPEDREPG